MPELDQRIECRWCHAQGALSERTCERCGAPLDARDVVSDSGWREAPRLRDLTEIKWSSSSCQLDSGVVPVVEVQLAGDDSVFFEHHVMLWKDDSVPMGVMNAPGGSRRLLSGMPFVLSVARASGRVAFSRDAPGEVVVLPLDQPAELDVREHALLLATTTLGYSFEKMPGVRAMLASGTGMYLDRYQAKTGPGLVVLHGYGNVFERVLGDGDVVLVDPGAFLYKDASVALELVPINLKGGLPPGAASTGDAAPGTVGDGGGGGGDGGPGPAETAPAAPPAASQGGGFLGRGLRGLKAARSMVNVGALASAAGSLRSGGGVQGAVASLASGGGSTMFSLRGPGRVGIQSMYRHHRSE